MARSDRELFVCGMVPKRMFAGRFSTRWSSATYVSSLACGCLCPRHCNGHIAFSLERKVAEETLRPETITTRAGVRLIGSTYSELHLVTYGLIKYDPRASRKAPRDMCSASQSKCSAGQVSSSALSSRLLPSMLSGVDDDIMASRLHAPRANRVLEVHLTSAHSCHLDQPT